MPVSKTYPNLKDVTYRLITSTRELEIELRSLEQSPILGLDCETTGLDPHRHTIRLIQLAAPNQPVILIDLPQIAPCDHYPLRQFLSSPAIKITHNGKFDWQFLAQAGLQPSAPFFDTQLAYRVLTAGLKTSLSLQTLAQKLLNIELDKTQQVSDWSKPLISQQLQYAALDAAVLLELYPILVKKLERSQLLKIAQLEFHCMPAVAQMELNGMLLDLSRWQTLGAKLESDRDAALHQIRELRVVGNAQMSLLPEMTDTINPNSPQQVLAALQAAGIPVNSTNQKELVPLAKRYPVIQALLDYRHLSKITATFADSLPRHIHPVTGRIHPTYYQLGARSGRFSCRNPPLQTIPRQAEIRNCFVAEIGSQIIKADYCIAEGTRVATHQGMTAIEQMLPGDLVYLEDGSLTQVAEVIERGKQPVVRITTDMGYELIATSLHQIRILNADGDYVWKRIGELESTDYVAIQSGRGFSLNSSLCKLPDLTYTHGKCKRITAPEQLSEDLALFMGYLTGDGTFHRNYLCWVVCDKDPDVDKWLIQIAEVLFHAYLGRSHYRGIFQTRIKSTALAAWLKLIGGSKSSVPEFLWRSPANIVAAYLKGLFEADGSVQSRKNGGRVSFSTIHELLAQQVQQLLLMLGIASTRSITQHGKGCGHIWILTIPAAFVSQFQETVGFMSQRKRNVLAELATQSGYSPSKGAMPNLQRKVKTLIASGEIRSKLYTLLNNTNTLGRPVSLPLAHKIMGMNSEVGRTLGLHRITDYKQLFVKVTKIEPIGERQVYDLSVPGSMTYISEGFISHNSQIELRIVARLSGDTRMQRAYRKGEDLHRLTAALVTGKAIADVSEEDRRLAKAINFGLIYGMGAAKLQSYAETKYGVTLSLEQAKAFRKRFFEAYAGVAEWHETIKRSYIRGTKESRTLGGRRRRWADKPRLAELLNHPVQGLNADITKLALVKLNKVLAETGAKLICTVHDEILLECPVAEAKHISYLLSRCMVAAARKFLHPIPVVVDVKVSASWGGDET